MWSNCRHCGKWFESKRDNKWRRRGVRAGQKFRTCSQECAKLRAEVLLIRRTKCLVCGGDKESRYAVTCSPECKSILKARSATGKVQNLCHFTASTEEEYQFMLKILHRKGYAKASDWKEKWTYCTEGYPEIRWVDRVARGVVVSRETSSSKKQQGHADGVQPTA